MLQKAIPVKNYSLIGKVLCKVKPEVAQEILSIVQPGQETDVTRIFKFYAIFDQGYTECEKPVDLRRIFTAAMLKLYHPKILEGGFITMQHGFVKNVAACLSCKSQAVTLNIREAVVMYRSYQDFQSKVNRVFDLIMKQHEPQ